MRNDLRWRPPTTTVEERGEPLSLRLDGGSCRVLMVFAVVLGVAFAGCGWVNTSTGTDAPPIVPIDPGPNDSTNATSTHPGLPAAASTKAAVKADAKPPAPAPEGMVWIPGGSFWMGADDSTMTDAKPVHEVTVSGFWMDRTEVTNRQFAKFVAATGYVTIAERKPDPKDFPDAPPEKLVPGSIVFSPPAGRVSLDDPMVWWSYVPGADWRHPEGPGSAIEGKDDYPAVHICWDDAMAYAKWAGKRLPTEAEWECASRGGKARTRFVWGNELRPEGTWRANIWQGRFPDQNSSEDGFARTAPTGSFPPNGFGLVDMAGNVWEWCSDWYRPEYDTSQLDNPVGPASSFDPNEPGVPKRVQRGGSFLCSDQYCTRYLPGARGKGAPDSAASHVGFRCVLSPGSSH